MMIWYDDSWGWTGWLVMLAGMLVLWGLIMWAVITVTRDPTVAAPDPERMLAERFARGELDDAEYQQRLATLRAGRTPAGRR